MDRKLFMDEVEKLITNIRLEEISKAKTEEQYKNISGRNGIYFLYNDENEVIYIGKVGNGKRTSLYHRIYGHGNGAHKNKKWFEECKKFKFKRFPNATIDDLCVIERLMIFKMEQPKYNDIGRITCNFDDIFNRVK